MKKVLFYLLMLIIVGSACQHNRANNTEKWMVASEMGDCVGVAPMKCLLIRKEGQTDWEFLYTGIEGFEYEPGYEYEIEIRPELIEAPVADRSSIRYILVKQISKNKKQSENLPVIPKRQKSPESESTLDVII